MEKVLILYSEFGYGHLSVANSLKENTKYISYLHNCKKEQNPLITRIIEKGYSNFFTKNASNALISNLYGFFFWSGNQIKPIVNYAIQKPGYKAVDKLIKQYNPDLIICTYPYKIKTTIPIITVVTDYGYANCWKANKDENYFVTDQGVKNKLIQKGVNQKDIHITGIPVNKKFDFTNSSDEVSTILFNLGARGQFKYSNLIKVINEVKKKEISIIVVCGKNEKLYNKLLSQYENQENIQINPFVTNIEQLIDKSDLVITKAGGISISECIWAQKPMIINKTQSLKGQEAFNVKFIKDNNLGYVSEEKQILDSIQKICENKLEYQEIKNNIIKIKEQYSENDLQSTINFIIKQENNV